MLRWALKINARRPLQRYKDCLYYNLHVPTTFDNMELRLKQDR